MTTPSKNSIPVDAKTFVSLSPIIKGELRRLAVAGSLAASATLKHVFTQLFGPERTREEERRFMLYAAPLARRIAIELANSTDRLGDTDVQISDLKEWLWWLDTFDPLCARMVDLHYFAGLSTKETAAALGLKQRVVVRDLRFAKAWLSAKLL